MVQRIMVIDDDQGLRSFLQKGLVTAGYEVVTVDRGAVGLQRLLTEPFDLVLIDINMPEISGPAVCKALRKHEKTRELPVVMMTAMFHSPEQIDLAKAEYGANAFLMKPFTVPDLIELVSSLIPENSDPKPEPPRQVALSQTSVPKLLHDLYGKKATGLLHLRRGEAKKIIYIKDGYPIFARSNVLSECLGRMLVRDGAITQVDCDASVERSRESGRLQGTVLIEMGLLTPQELHAALSRQVTEKLLSTFAWQDGTSQFVAGKDFKKNVSTIQLSPAALILSGISRYWSTQQLDHFLNPLRNDYLKQATNPLYRFQDVKLNKRGEALLGQCRGTLTLEEILDLHPLARAEVKQTLAALLLSEMIVASTTPEEADVADMADVQPEQPIDEELRQKILADYKRIMEADYFAVLGVTRQCGSSEVRRAYYKLAKDYHPDRFLGSGLSQEMSSKINEMFQYISQAYSVLSDPTACSAYLEELTSGPKKTININQVIEAETAYQEGRTLLKSRRYTAATVPLKRSIELCPEEPEYLTQYAWAVFKSSPESPDAQKRALEVLLASRELNPGLDLTHLYLGHVYQVQGKERQSEKSFELAVQANPDCTEALRELRLLNLRREQASHAKGLFKKFIHKED